MKISARIYELMEQKGMDQLTFSKKTGIAQSTISDWRTKNTNPASNKIMIIADVLKVNPKKILMDDEGNYCD